MPLVKQNPLSSTDPVIAGLTIANAQVKTSPVVADAVLVMDSAAANTGKQLTLGNLTTLVRTGVTTAPAVGQIGELVTWTSAGQTLQSGTNFTCGNTNASVDTLSAGVWMLNGSLFLSEATTITFTGGFMYWRNLTDSSTLATFVAPTTGACANNINFSMPTIVITLATAKRIGMLGNFSWSAGTLTASANTFTMYAVRIA